MTTIKFNQGKGGSDGKDFVVLPSDVYRMKILKATVEENRFADPEKDGTKPLQLVLTWEMTAISDEQREAMEEAGEDWNTAQVWQRMSLFYGDVRAGGPSKCKAFIDGLREQGYLEGFDPDDFDLDTLAGIEQRVNVERYIKGQGENAGKPGNKVVSVLPLKRKRGVAEARNIPQPGVVEEAALPF
jgi:hypothetical protein